VETQSKTTQKMEEKVRLMAEEGTLCINDDVKKKAGTHASATSITEAYTNIYIKQAEGRVCGESRVDHITNYTLYKDWFKELLREATSNLAATYAINWDIIMSNYPYEALDMINFLYESYKDAMKLIQDKNVITAGTI